MATTQLYLRTRQVVSSEIDDYFSDDTIVFYLNKAKEAVISEGLRFEQQNYKSLRLLDNLRATQSNSVNGITFTLNGSFYTFDITLPTTLREIKYVEYNTIPVVELPVDLFSELRQNAIAPTKNELYYYITNNGTNNVLRCITYSNDSTTSNTLDIHYLNNPSLIDTTTITLGDLPDRIENAVIYNAAISMLMQQEIDDAAVAQTIQMFTSKFNQELSTNLY